MTATFSTPTSPQLPLKACIHCAVGKVIYQHPTLAAIPVDGKTRSLGFARLPNIDLDRAVIFHHRSAEHDEQVCEDSELDKMLQSEHNEPFEHEEPPTLFWRLVVLVEAGSDSISALPLFLSSCASRWEFWAYMSSEFGRSIIPTDGKLATEYNYNQSAESGPTACSRDDV